MNNLPAVLIDELTIKVQALSRKYATTYKDIVNEIAATETELASFIDELEGNEFDKQGLQEFKSFLKGA